MSQTTIQISNDVKATLLKQRISEKESYNEIIERILEDSLDYTEETKKDIEESKKQAEKGEVYSLEEMEELFGVN
jgi:predicted transcriptional regulator